MIVRLHRSFEKKFKKLRVGERERCRERITLFAENPFHPLLDNHPLKGDRKGEWAIHIGGDLSAIYELDQDDTVALFTDVDTHHNLYGS